jgi:hypothetical protein
MRNHPYGTALYTPLPARRFYPGICGYFDANGSWNPVADLSNPVLLASQGYGPAREKLQRAPLETNIEWGPKASENVKARKIELSAGISSTIAAAMPAELAAWYNFSTSMSGGAILLTIPPVTHERFYYESPFKAWIRENAEALIKRRNEILEFGLWIVTSTWSTSECAINVWDESRKGVNVGFNTSVVAVGELGPAGVWQANVKNGGWVKYKAANVSPGNCSSTFRTIRRDCIVAVIDKRLRKIMGWLYFSAVCGSSTEEFLWAM